MGNKKKYKKWQKMTLINKIINLYKDGFNTKQIAKKLDMKEGTVSSWYFTHFKHKMKKETSKSTY